jgi:hypothetical protein
MFAQGYGWDKIALKIVDLFEEVLGSFVGD